MVQSDQKPVHICFVAPKAYSALSVAADARHIGGAEVQQTLIAQGLLNLGYRVSFIVQDHGQPDAFEAKGITVYRSYRPDAGLPHARFLHPRLTGLWSAMTRADADVYYQRTSDPLTGIVAAFARAHRRPFVFSVGHDGDCNPDLPFCHGRRERILYLFGLKRANAIVAQTLRQKQQLLAHYGIEATVIHSCVALSTGQPRVSPAAIGLRPRLLWVGRFAPEKRLELLLDVAPRCPRVDFVVIGDGPPDDYVRQLTRRAAAIANVRLAGYVPHRQMPQYYQTAVALICTSSSEGFPNVFLEAWVRGLPLVTTFDPDDIVAHGRFGIVAHHADTLVDAVNRIAFDRRLWSQMSDASYDYSRQHHTIEVVSRSYDTLLRTLCETAAPLRRRGHASFLLR